jgi:hypothetical protein
MQIFVQLRQRQIHIHLQLTLMLVLFSLCSTNASPIIAPRAIVRPIPLPDFNVSVFDEATGAPIPQAQASDGGGLINGRVFSAPNVIWAIAALAIGLPLGLSGVRLWRVTTSLGGGLSLAFASRCPVSALFAVTHRLHSVGRLSQYNI